MLTGFSGAGGPEHFPTNARDPDGVELTERSARRRTTSGVALLVGVVAAGVACGPPCSSREVRPHRACRAGRPGPVRRLGAASRRGGDPAGVGVHRGALLVAGAGPPGFAHGDPRRRAAAVAAWTWMATVLLAAVLEACNLAGVRLPRPGPRGAAGLAGPVEPAAPPDGGGALRRDRREHPRGHDSPRHAGPLVLALLDAAVLGLDGHAAADSELVQSGIVVHVVAALLWTGGLAALLLHVRGDRAALQVGIPLQPSRPRLLRRDGRLRDADGARDLAVVRGRIVERYAGIVAAKVGVLLALGLAGHRHRTRTFPRLRRGDPRAFLRLAAGEVVVMGAGLGLAAALARRPCQPRARRRPTATGRPSRRPDLGRDAHRGAAQRGGPAGPRPGEGRLRDGGSILSSTGGWPRRRSAAFGAALVATLVATCSGMAAYAHTRPSLLVAQLLTMLGVVPALALLGRPVELARRAGYDTSSLQALRGLVTPASGAVAASLLVLALRHTPVVDWRSARPGTTSCCWRSRPWSVPRCCGRRSARPARGSAASPSGPGGSPSSACASWCSPRGSGSGTGCWPRSGSSTYACRGRTRLPTSGSRPAGRSGRTGAARAAAAVTVRGPRPRKRTARPGHRQSRSSGQSRMTMVPRSSADPIEP